MKKVWPQARAALASLLPGALLAVYLVMTDCLIIPMDPPGDGAAIMEKSSAPRTMRPSGAAKLPVRPPSRPLDQHLVNLVSPLNGVRIQTSEQKLWEALVKDPRKTLLYYQIAQVHGLRKEPDKAVQMLRLAAKHGMPAAHFTQQALLGEQTMDSIRYDPDFVMYVRGLPEK